MLLETSQVYWRGLTDTPVSLERVKSVTMAEWIQIFEVGRHFQTSDWLPSATSQES